MEAKKKKVAAAIEEHEKAEKGKTPVRKVIDAIEAERKDVEGEAKAEGTAEKKKGWW